MTTAELRTGRNERLSMQITRQGVVRKDGCQGRVACWVNSQRVAVVPKNDMQLLWRATIGIW